MILIRKIALLCALAMACPAIASTPWSDAMLISNGSASSAAVEWTSGYGVFAVQGAFSGATVTLEFLGSNGTNYQIVATATTCTAVCAGVFYLPDCFIKALVSGGTPSALYAAAARASN